MQVTEKVWFKRPNSFDGINRYDPIYWILYHAIFKNLLNPKKPGGSGHFELESAEKDFLFENLLKHTTILWLNALLLVYLFLLGGLEKIESTGDPATVVTGLLAPAMVTGGAWYTVSFGGIPTQFSNVAMILTRYMFLAFTLSMTLLTALLCYITDWILASFVLIPITLCLYTASIYYDTMDGLKIGLDATLLKFSRASLNFYRKNNLLTEEETLRDQFDEDSGRDGKNVAVFDYHQSILEEALKRLDSSARDAAIANHLIATATEAVIGVTLLASTEEEQVTFHKMRSNLFADVATNAPSGASAIDTYVHSSHQLSVGDVDDLTVGQIRLLIPMLRNIIQNQDPFFDQIEKQLEHFNEFTSSAKETSEDFKSSQVLSDYLFSHTFSQLAKLIKAYSHEFINPRRVE